MPQSSAAGKVPNIAKERRASVRRIGIHLKGARILVALATHLDTPTAAATAAAVAAAAATVKEKEANARRATGERATATADTIDEAATIVDYLDEENLEDQSPDAEVLPRGWEVTDGAPVYPRKGPTSTSRWNRGWRKEDSCNPFPRHDDTSPYPQRNESSPHLRRNTHTGVARGIERSRYDEQRRRRSGGMHEEETRGHSTAGSASAAGAGQKETCSAPDHGQIRWREITKQPFALLLLVDGGEELGRARVLLSMPEYGSEEQDRARREGKRPGGLYICPSMAEYYLLLSVYFGKERMGRVKLGVFIFMMMRGLGAVMLDVVCSTCLFLWRYFEN